MKMSDMEPLRINSPMNSFEVAGPTFHTVSDDRIQTMVYQCATTESRPLTGPKLGPGKHTCR